MNVREFNKKYREKGGISKLIEMQSMLIPQKTIAKHFGVSQERIRQWTVEFFGYKYDPRQQRREIRNTAKILSKL